MRKQLSRLCGGKRSAQHLPAISEEAVNDTLLQKREGREEIIQLIQSRDKCGHSDTQNRCDKEGRQTEERKTLLFQPIHGETSTDDRKRLFESTTNLLFQAEKQKDLSEAKVLFPDFFQQGTLHGSWSAEKNDAHPWLQVYLGWDSILVTGVATQGMNGLCCQWVTKYNLQYSDDNVNFRYYREPRESIKVTLLN